MEYEVSTMVVKATKITIENKSGVMCPNARPCADKISPNSPTWASEFATRNAGFFVYLNNEQIVIVISGFMMRTTIISINMASLHFLKTTSYILIPRETKKRSEKKSFKLFIFPIISCRYSNVPRVRPPTNAPTASENPRYSKVRANKKQVARLVMKSSSWLFAAVLKSLGKRYLLAM